MVPEPARSDLTGLSSFSFLALAVVHEPSANETATAVPKQRAAASPAIDGSYPRPAGALLTQGRRRGLQVPGEALGAWRR